MKLWSAQAAQAPGIVWASVHTSTWEMEAQRGKESSQAHMSHKQ